ncbi:MAG: polynucleotide adenylyltransferase PcnB [Gammaproteobacteria bacterium]|nr:MAG: polynucleotide adenylyltransferase PcnB [Gammaproteobacteria bacterium]
MDSSKPTAVVTKIVRKPQIIPRTEHGVSRSEISENALKVLYRLKNAGYHAYLVGGGVRDILLGLKPKDFDVATDAHPEQVRELFRNCRLIGRRFRLAHVHFGREIIEVSTFRASHNDAVDGEGHEEDGRIIRDNVYGTLDDDVWRRDFTVNALYYNIEDYSIVDYVGGLEDIKNRQLRLIGIPEDRYREDPVRMLRAIRFAIKLDFSIHPVSEQPIRKLAPLLEEIPEARLFEEFLKLFMSGQSEKAYQQLREYGLFAKLFPQTEEFLNRGDEFIHKLLISAFRNTDTRLAEDKPVTPAFLLAALLWVPVRDLANDHEGNGLSEMDAIHLASDAVISHQISSTSMPRRFTHMARDMWALQVRLKNIRGKRPLKLLAHQRFRAAYDFLLLRAEAGEDVQELASWWTAFQEEHMDIQLAAKKEHQKKRFRHRQKRFR